MKGAPEPVQGGDRNIRPTLLFLSITLPLFLLAGLGISGCAHPLPQNPQAPRHDARIPGWAQTGLPKGPVGPVGFIRSATITTLAQSQSPQDSLDLSIPFGTRSGEPPTWGQALFTPNTPTPAPPPSSAAPPASGRTTSPNTTVIIQSPAATTEKATQPEPADSAKGPPLSNIESLYNRIPQLSRGKAIRQFGYDTIRAIDASGTVANVPDTYIVGPGDELELRASGGLELDETAVIDREGKIFLPRVGAVGLGGTSIREINALITNLLRAEFKDFELSVTLNRLRTLSVTVTGYVQTPGQVSVPANTSVLQLLATVGGIRPDGTLRAVRWTTSGEPRVLDLYGLLVSGDTSHLGQIADGDQLHVPALGPTAAVLGPGGAGIFEWLPGDSLATLARYASAENAFADQAAAQLERAATTASPGRPAQRQRSTLPIAQLPNTPVRDSDVLALGETLDLTANPVHLEGAVLRPGTIAFTPGLTVADLLQSGGGFTFDASLQRALLLRRTGPASTYDQLPGDAAGRLRERLIWIDLQAILNGVNSDPTANLPLQPHDRLRILTRDDIAARPTVSIGGAIRKPGTYPLTVGLTLGDLLQLAGGPTADAFKGPSLLVRRATPNTTDGHSNITSIPFHLAESLSGGPAAQAPLANLDRVMIRRTQPGQIEATIDGRVPFPGTYTLPRNARITDLIAQAGGLLDDANLRAAVFSRERVRQQQTARLTDMLTRSEERFARVRDLNTRDGSAGESLAGQLALLGLRNRAGTLNRVQATGRIVIDFLAPDFPATPGNLALEPGDRLTVPGRLHTVTVVGRVFSPNAFLHQPGHAVADYLDQAGGMLDDADKKQAYVILASGEVVSAAQRGGARTWNRFVPGPGDTILVPPKPVERSALSKAGDSLGLVRELTELGLIGSAIPASGATATSIPLDIGRTRNTPAATPALPVEAILRGEAGIQP